jgi:hypothetical protein
VFFGPPDRPARVTLAQPCLVDSSRRGTSEAHFRSKPYSTAWCTSERHRPIIARAPAKLSANSAVFFAVMPANAMTRMRCCKQSHIRYHYTVGVDWRILAQIQSALPELSSAPALPHLAQDQWHNYNEHYYIHDYELASLTSSEAGLRTTLQCIG